MRQFWKMHLGRLAGAHAELVFLLAGDEARRAALDDERRDALVALARVGDGHHDHRVARRAVRDEGLAAVQHPAVAVAHGGRAHRRRVAARARLGQPPGRQLLAARERREEPLASGRRLPNSEMCAAPRPLCAATDSDTLGSTRASSSMQMQ